MADITLPTPLTRLFSREIRLRLFNGLIFFALCNTVLYVLLLFLMLFFGIPVYPVYLTLFISLSLLPLYLLPLWKKGANTLVQTLRRIDDQCRIESFLFTDGEAQRKFLSREVYSLLEYSLKKKRPFWRLIDRKSWRLLAVNTLLLILYILATFLMFKDAEIILSPQALKSKAVRIAIEAQTEEGGEPGASLDMEDSQRIEGSPTPEAQSAGVDSEALERVEMAGSGDSSFEPGQRGPAPGDQAPGEIIQRPSEPGEIPERDPSISPDSGTNNLEEGQTPATRYAQRQGQSDTPTYDAGKSFLESPLREYSAFRQRLFAEGSQDVRPGSVLEEDPKEQFLVRLFGDFRGGTVIEAGYPLEDQIRDKYLRLIDETP